MKDKSIFKIKYSAALNIVLYLAIMFLVSTILLAILCGALASTHDLSSMDLIEATSVLSDNDKINKYAALAMGVSNLLTYLLLFIVLVIFSFELLHEDILKVKDNKLLFIIQCLIFGALFYVIINFVSLAVSNYVSDSENQETIENVVNQGYAIPMFIATVFFAPVVEELIYRGAIFRALKKYHVTLSILVSSICFALPHMISTKANIGDFIIISLPYLMAGFMLSLIYYRTNKNIYIVIICHMINNFISMLAIML